MYERFTDNARRIFQRANQEAQKLNHGYLGTEHVILGLLNEDKCKAISIIKKLGCDPISLRLKVLDIVKPDTVGTPGKLPQTPKIRMIIEEAISSARELQNTFVGSEHLLLGSIHKQLVGSIAYEILVKEGLTYDKVFQEVRNMRLDQLEKAIESKSITKNEVLEELGFPPTSEKWGNEIAGTNSPLIEQKNLPSKEDVILALRKEIAIAKSKNDLTLACSLLQEIKRMEKEIIKTPWRGKKSLAWLNEVNQQAKVENKIVPTECSGGEALSIDSDSRALITYYGRVKFSQAIDECTWKDYLQSIFPTIKPGYVRISSNFKFSLDGMELTWEFKDKEYFQKKE